MAKKAGTIIIETLEHAPINPDGRTVTLTVETRDHLVKLAKRVDKRDEQKRKPRKKAKKAAR